MDTTETEGSQRSEPTQFEAGTPPSGDEMVPLEVDAYEGQPHRVG
jgi:hypothetical protein